MPSPIEVLTELAPTSCPCTSLPSALRSLRASRDDRQAENSHRDRDVAHADDKVRRVALQHPARLHVPLALLAGLAGSCGLRCLRLHLANLLADLPHLFLTHSPSAGVYLVPSRLVREVELRTSAGTDLPPAPARPCSRSCR